MKGKGRKYSCSFYLSWNCKIFRSPGTSHLIHSCQEYWPRIVSSFPRQYPQEELFLQMAQHAASPKGEQTVSQLCTVLLSFQMDVVYDLSPTCKNSIFMMEFYIIWLFTCQGVGVQTFPLSEELLRGKGLYPSVPYRVAWGTQGHLWTHYTIVPVAQGRRHINKCKTNVAALQTPVVQSRF